MKHLHIFSSANSYFPQSFIPFVQEYCEGEHCFMVRHDAPHLHAGSQVIAVNFDQHLSGMVPLMLRFDCLWIHSLFNDLLGLTLAQREALTRRAVWIVWGGELFNGSEALFTLRRILTPLFRAVALFTPQEIPLFLKTFGMPQNIYPVFYPNPLPAHSLHRKCLRKTLSPRVLLGHSAWPTERHREGLTILRASPLAHARIFMPMSYGDERYAEQLQGETKTVTLRRPLSPERYARFLGHMNAALMLQHRQSALSTIYALLFMGIPVYVQSADVRNYLRIKYGITLVAPDALASMTVEEALCPLPPEQQQKAKRFFDISHIASLWNTLFRQMT